MSTLEDDPERWEPAAIRSFFLDRASHCGNGTVEKLTTSLRAFLRYLAVKPNFDTLGVWTSVKAAEMLDFARC